MVLKKVRKEEVMGKYAQSKGDTGSPEVQVALLTERINSLVEHLKKNKKDNHSRRGLLMIVSQRKKLLMYLQGKDASRHQKLSASLGLR
ncbi:MAG: 30S ribosomal protein S15 [Candidatus Margulisbacteria bacterium]|nr:30S ribosomal protein S15 [Candidatus Margulisiibacteriota bacterium]